MARDGRILTARQLEVLELVSKGLSNTDIARVLDISPNTVKTHVAAVLDSLGAASRTEAAVQLEALRSARVDGLGAAPVPGFGSRPTVAILPFDDLVGPDAPWLATGLLGDLTQRMGGVRWFPIIDREAAGRMAPGRRDGDGSTASYLVDGSIAREGDRLVVTVQLWDTARGEVLWAERFDRRYDDLVSLQEEMVDRIVSELEPAILQIERVRAVQLRAESIAVWDSCKRAEHALASETREGQALALQLFERATEIDPRSVRAWSGLALAQASALYLGFTDDPRRTAGEARAAGDRAVDLVPESYEAQLALGRALAMGREHDSARPHLTEALETNPSSAVACNTLAGALRRQGETDAAIPLYERTVALAPRAAPAYHAAGGLALAHIARSDYETALDWARRVVEAGPESGDATLLDFYPILPATLALLGRIDEARTAWDARPQRPEGMRHSRRFVGPEGAALVEGLRLAGWDGTL